MSKKVMVAMSGGVDSSAAALLLLEQGYELMGATLRMFDPEKLHQHKDCQSCGSNRDAEDAKAVCAKLGFPHYLFSMEPQFEQYVIKQFVESYQKGQTPNPCVECNKHIKFDAMLEKAVEMGNDYLATGHYANVCYDPRSGRYLLKKAAGIIVEEEGASCHAAIVGAAFDIPVIVGAKNATKLLKTGTTITMDSSRGLVVSGVVNPEKK